MKSKRLAALLTASAILLTGCDPAELFLGNELSSQISQHADLRYPAESVRTQIEDLQKIWGSDGHEAEVSAAIPKLVSAVDDASAVFLRAEMQYYADWDNADLAALREQTSGDFSAVSEMVLWAMANGAHRSHYEELFAPYEDKQFSDYYLANSLGRVISSAKQRSAESRELLDDYYDTAFSEELPQEETNESCAKLYLKTLEDYDLSKYLYDLYARDYTAEDSAAVYQKLLEKLIPLFRSLHDTVRNDPRAERLRQGGYTVDDPLETLRKYAPKISADISESAEKLISEKLCTLAHGEHCYNGSYTVSLPGERSAMIYLFQTDTFYDLPSAAHEFGHFHADWRDTTPTIKQKTCIDIAEVQSQGMELLMTHFYPEIYGEDAAYLELLELFNMLDSVISGFAIGEFEYEVMQKSKNCSAAKVLEIFDRIHGEADLGMELYQCTHLFENPGYYVSYGVSALAALEIYGGMQKDFSAAAAQYERMAQISPHSGEYKLRAALAKAGMSDIFAEDTLDAVANTLSERIAALTA